MNPLLGVRPLLARDLAACVDLARGDGARGPLVDESLLGRLLGRNLLIGRVIEERLGGDRRRVRAYGLSALADPAVVAAARHAEDPDLVANLLREAAAGESPILDRRDGSALGARGTRQMVVLNFVVDSSAEGIVETVTSLLHVAFIEAHSGYALAGLTAEVRPWERKAESYRMSLRSMGCAESPAHAQSAAQVFWLDAAFVNAQPFHILQPLFARHEAKLCLSLAHREILELASLGFDDASIAAALGIAIDTVHKRWRKIYERAQERMPALVSPTADAVSPEHPRATRGPEKRRALIEFARLHPEELRP
jgi:DNA-binding CsgD family transcriptional regulator